MRGLFITLEGPEGAGKSSQARQLASWLGQRGYPVLLTREPGGTPLGSKLRELLLEGEAMSSEAEFLLYSADRAEHQHLIEEALAKDQIVLSDRWLDSSLAYQGFGRGLDLQWLRAVSLGFIHRWPDRTFVLDLPPEVGLARRTKLNRLDRESLEFHRRVRSGYLTLAREEPERFQIIDAEASEEAVQAALRSALEPLLEAFKLC